MKRSYSNNSNSSDNSIERPTTTKRLNTKFASLSRNALYAPLKTYYTNTTQSTKQQDSNESTTRKSPVVINSNISNNLKEKNLYTFLEKISVEYHDSITPLGTLSGTNGGMPLKSRQMESKSSQRALTLIGGGSGNHSIVKSTSLMTSGLTSIIDDNLGSNSGNRSFKSTIASNQRKRKRGEYNQYRVHGSLSHKRRKRLQNQLIQHCTSTTKNNNIHDRITTNNISGTLWKRDILISLNELWIKYVNKLLYTATNANQNMKIKKEQVASLVSSAEMIGAHVLIQSNNNHQCRRQNHQLSKSQKFIHDGVIINVTKNTWRIACRELKKQRNNTTTTSSNNTDDEVKNKSSNDDDKWKVRIVPKNSFSLICMIPLPVQQIESNPNGDNDPSQKSCSLLKRYKNSGSKYTLCDYDGESNTAITKNGDGNDSILHVKITI